MQIEIPGDTSFELKHLVLDFNGTLAIDGKLITGVGERLEILSRDLNIHVLTADTFGSASQELKSLPVKLTVISAQNQDQAKLAFITKLETQNCVCVGNGNNDRLMLKSAALGIAVMQKEGCSRETLFASDIVCSSILDALELLHHPKRLAATLRT